MKKLQRFLDGKQMAPLVLEMKKDEDIEPVVVVTALTEMLYQVLTTSSRTMI